MTTCPCLAMLAAVVATSAFASAQTVSVSLRAQTPLTVATTGAAPITQTVPAGPMSPSGGVSANAPASGIATMTWWTAEGSTQASATIVHDLLGEAAGGPHDIVVEFTANAPTPVYLEIEQAFLGTTGATVPAVPVDVGNDGTYELGFLAEYSAPAGIFTLGAQPLAVRVHYEGAADFGTSATVSTIVRVIPRNDVYVSQAADGCFETSIVRPSFTGVAVLGLSPPINALSVLVVGFAPQPILLPPLAAPCLLYPQVDVLLPFWNVSAIEIPLTASVRPVELYLQRATLFGGQIVVDDAFRVQAL